jgi:hypothetical protein
MIYGIHLDAFEDPLDLIFVPYQEKMILRLAR